MRSTGFLLLLAAACATTEPMNFDELWNYSDPAATEAAFRAALPEVEAAGDADRHAQLLTQIARTHSLRRDFDAAHAQLDDVEPMLSEATPVARVRYLLERGRTHNSAGDRSAATELFLEAWESGHAAGADGHAADAGHMLAIVSPPEESLAWNERTIEFAESSDDPVARRMLAPLYNNTGHTYLAREDYIKALDLFENALEIRRENGVQGPILIAEWSVAHTLRRMGRTKLALARQQEILGEHNEAGTVDGYVFEELAECLWAMDRKDQARKHFKRAFEELSKDAWFAENEKERLARMGELGGE
ncbi:MAG: tetratricopeptide repeat protein [bacterium]|nr:tetratricopeptide repeat protein [bacterium]